MSEFDEYKFVEGMIEDIIDASAMQAIKGYRQLLIVKLNAVRDEIFDGEKDLYDIGQVDMIDYVLCILSEELRIKND